MKLETFFERFDQFADAPDVVAKMRDIVLHSAVHGRLVDQSSGDESARELLLKSRAEMARLMDLGIAKRERPAAPVPQEETTFSIPTGWTWCRLVDAGQFINGLAFKPTDWGPVGRPIIRIQNLSGRNLDYNRTTGTFDASVLVQDGDVLVSWSATLDAFIWRGEQAVLNQHIFRVLPAPLADKGYLYWLLKWVIRQLAASVHAHGLVMSHINRGPFLAHPIPLPPLAEQKRIVAKVDELMALCDQLEAQQQDRETRHAALARASLARFADAPTPANLHLLFHKSYTIPPADLRKSILTLGVQGKLVPQDPNDQSAEELLSQISAEQDRLVRERLIRRQDTRPLGDDEQPFSIPATWAWTRLGRIGDWGSGSTPPRGNHELYGGNVAWLKSGELNDNRTLAGSEETVTELAVKACSFRLNKPGDVLLAMYGATIGKIAILAEAAVTNQAVCGCTPFSGVLNTYLFHYLLSQREAFHAASEGGAQPNISKVKIVGYPFPLPPLAEQCRIVAKVDQLMALVDQLETLLAASRATAERLMEAVVAELTAQE